MKDTTFYPTKEQLDRVAQSYTRNNDGALEAAPLRMLGGPVSSRERMPMANGGLFSTASDYYRFCRMLLDGGRFGGKALLKPESVRQMTTVQSGDVKTGFTPGNGWGLGVCVVREPQGITSMLSNGSFGHGGAFGTQAWVDPKLRRIYILMVQRANFPNSDDSPVRLAFQKSAAPATNGGGQ
jgi:CubicO group peptidase (beta-lactamase class C family)